MDLQFYGANCVSLTHRGTRLVIDDNLAELGAKSIIKPEDVALFTGKHGAVSSGRLTLDGPGEYEVSDTSVIGIPARAHMDEPGELTETAFRALRVQLFEPSEGQFRDNLAQRSMLIKSLLTCRGVQSIIELEGRAHMRIITSRIVKPSRSRGTSSLRKRSVATEDVRFDGIERAQQTERGERERDPYRRSPAPPSRSDESAQRR